MDELNFKVFGDEAKKLCDFLGLKMSGDMNDINTKVRFTYKPVEGHTIVEVTIRM